MKLRWLFEILFPANPPIRTTLWFRRFLAGVSAVVFLAAGARAQSSVEKIETSQQASQPVDSAGRASDAVLKSEAKPQSGEPGGYAGAYAFSSSIEVGYRFVADRGSHDRFRSELNLRDGLRLLDYQFDSRAINGRGALFDFLRGDVSNAGGDGSQYYSVRAEKSRIYRFDGTVRQFNYYRFLPSFVNGQHGFDLNQQVSDFNLKLLPQRPVRIDLGYTRSRASGPMTGTYVYDFDDFRIDAEERWEANDYRLGLETGYRRWNFLLGGMYRTYKSDRRYFQDAGVNRGNIPNDRVTLNSFDRFTADRANAALARWGLSGAPTTKLHLAARGHYTDERLEGALRESNSGVNNLNVPILAQSVNADGVAKRSSATSDVAITYDLTEYISVSDTFDYNALRIPGDARGLIQTRTLPPGGNEQTVTAPTINSRLTDLTSYWNTLQVNLNLGAKFSGNLGWRATRRDVRLDILPNRQARTTNNTQAFKRTIVATISSAALIWSLWLPGPSQAGQTQDEETKKLYALNCAVCHASDGSGDTAIGKQLKASDLRSEKVQKESNQELYDFIAKGKKKMPGFEKKLGKEQISRLVTYLRALAEGR